MSPYFIAQKSKGFEIQNHETKKVHINIQPVREAVSYRGLFTAGWFGVREKHCSRLKIYDRLRASEQAACSLIAKRDLLSHSPYFT